MRCPKCGYNSFEHNDACPKCSSDVTGFKGTFGLAPLVFPQAIRAVMAEELMAGFDSAEDGNENVEAATDMFSFDLPDDTPATPAAAKDPFDFDDTPSSSDLGTGVFSFDEQPEAGAKEDDPFASLLESTSQSDGDPFAALAAPSAPSPVAAAANSPGEFDLNNFSWDDSPPSAAAETATPVEDDFDSLFGDMDDAAKK